MQFCMSFNYRTVAYMGDYCLCIMVLFVNFSPESINPKKEFAMSAGIIFIISLLLLSAFLCYIVISRSVRNDRRSMSTYTKVKILHNESAMVIESDINEFLHELKDAGAVIDKIIISHIYNYGWKGIIIYRIIIYRNKNGSRRT